VCCVVSCSKLDEWLHLEVESFVCKLEDREQLGRWSGWMESIGTDRLEK
jgi:hypothetical protein